MNTETLTANLRRAIDNDDGYHIGLYGEEACRRLMQQKRALDAFESRRDAARGADMHAPDTEPAPAESGRETAIVHCCVNCRWYVPERSSYDMGFDGECRRFPEWSTRTESDWCGEWSE